MSTKDFLNEFWYRFTTEQKIYIIENCKESYSRFLKGEATEKDYEVIKEHIKNIIDDIDNKFVGNAEYGHLNIVKT